MTGKPENGTREVPSPRDAAEPFPKGDPCYACDPSMPCRRIGYCWWLAETPEEMANDR